jgi:hypothetical protein
VGVVREGGERRKTGRPESRVWPRKVLCVYDMCDVFGLAMG